MTTPDMILRLPAVRSRCGLSRSSIYLKVRKGEFPRPISLGSRAIGWLASEVSLWLADRVAVSRNSTSVPPGALPESRP